MLVDGLEKQSYRIEVIDVLRGFTCWELFYFDLKYRKFH